MPIRLSTGFRNGFAQGFGLRELLRDGRLYVLSGTQPASADSAPTGTLLCTFTLAGGSYTGATAATTTLTITGGSGGDSVDTVKVGGAGFNLLGSAVAWATSDDNTAILVAAAINATQNPWNITAARTSSGVCTLYAPAWMGAGANAMTCAVTETGGSTITVGNTGTFAGGVTSSNGLNFQFPAASGVLSKEATVWQGTAAATGTASYFRFVAGGSTYDGVSGSDVRFDGSIATSGGDLTISSSAIVSGAIQTISAFTLTIPAA
jgi:hypothetical protein